MRYFRPSLVSGWLAVTLGAAILLLPACSSNVGAQPPPEPTAQTQPGSKPGQPAPTTDARPRPTLAPNDPAQPVSNQTPITPSEQNASQVKISGRVTNAAGEPLARARLAFSQSSVPMPEIAYLTNANGEYSMLVPRGEYTLAVFADGYAAQERQLDTRTESQTQADFVLQPQ